MTDCRLGVHALGAGGVGSNPTGVTLFPRRYSLKAEHRKFSDSQLRRSLLKHIPTAVLEYMAHNPEVAGSIPASAVYKQRFALWSNGSSPYVSDAQLRWDTKTHSTAGLEYMAMQVRFPPGPLT